MSYILEALKRSQQERELGHVPKLEAVTLDDPTEEPPSHRWVVVAVLMALVAVGFAGYAIMRDPRPPEAETASVDAGSAGTPLPLPAESGSKSASRRQSPAPAENDEGEVAAEAGLTAEHDLPETDTAATLPPPPPEFAQPPPAEPMPSPPGGSGRAAEVPGTTVADAPPGLREPGSLGGGEPQVLVVPAAPKAGEPLPRGAEELRRAVLGTDRPPSAEAPPYEPPLAAEPPRAARRELPAPVPPDLIADIEAFKKDLGDGGKERPVEKVPPPLPTPEVAREEDPELPPPPSYALRLKLPEYSMPVHIYDSDPARRFVYINGRKVKESERSREGLLLERVVADGAILSYEGERFFQPR